MKKYIILNLCILSMVFNSFAQSTVDVDVSGISFTPADIIILVGDTVRWTNTGGVHNVNGTTATYPLNPQSFGNAIANNPWVYTHVFTVNGVYDYQCDVHVSSGMVGTITVLIPTSIENTDDAKMVINAYPNPADNLLTLELDNKLSDIYPNITMFFYDNTGRRLALRNVIEKDKIRIDTKELTSGVYHYQLVDKDQVIYSDKFIVQ